MIEGSPFALPGQTVITTQTRSGIYRIGRKEFDFSSRAYVMGILNVTPDSFSDGGRYFSADAAVGRAREMIVQGADLIDIGGESSRPKGTTYGEGAAPIDAAEELRRIIPVIRRLAGESDIPISVDTWKADVAREALAAGASMVNDISGFRLDPAMARVVGDAGASAVVMHMKGTPETMQQNPVYDDLFGEILGYLRTALRAGEDAGIRQMFVDPGIGFGKTPHDNLRLIAGLRRLTELGYPVLAGPSRKSFLGTILDSPVEDRLEGSIAAAVACVLNGASIVRVHDVRQTKRALLVAAAIVRAGDGTGEKSRDQ